MGFHASWVHGNALTVENPENLNRVGHFGWGADMQVKPGKSSWFHIALPTPVILSDARSNLNRVFLMFETEQGSIRNVHVFDGSFNECSPIAVVYGIFAMLIGMTMSRPSRLTKPASQMTERIQYDFY